MLWQRGVPVQNNNYSILPGNVAQHDLSPDYAVTLPHGRHLTNRISIKQIWQEMTNAPTLCCPSASSPYSLTMQHGGSLANPFYWSLRVLSESMLVSPHFFLKPSAGALCTRSWINGREDILCRKCVVRLFPPMWPLKQKKGRKAEEVRGNIKTREQEHFRRKRPA